MRSRGVIKTVVFRSLETPEWTPEEIKQKLQLWETQLDERVKSHLTSGMSRDEVIAINARATAALVRQIARTYELRIYTCVNGNNIATLQTA